MTWIVALLILAVLGSAAMVHRGTRWGSTPDERALGLPGDDYLAVDRRARVAMTRAISIRARPETVWPWVAQMGRGAGWYSVDWLDNGRKLSARHIVSWIPEPEVGDATATGYLRHVETGRGLAWWAKDGPFPGGTARLRRLLHAFPGTGRYTRDQSHLRRRRGGAHRAEQSEADREESRSHETGDRAQYPLDEILYARGEGAGVAGSEAGARWREVAIRDGVLDGGR